MTEDDTLEAEEVESAHELAGLINQFLQVGNSKNFLPDSDWKLKSEHLRESVKRLYKVSEQDLFDEVCEVVEKTMDYMMPWIEFLPANFTRQFEHPYASFFFEPEWLPLE